MKSTQQLEAEARQFMSQGDFQNSIHTLNQALGIPQTSKPLDLARIARLFNNLGFAHRELRDLPTAEKYFQAQYCRLAARRGKHRAAVAAGHSLLVTGYHLITGQRAYQDLGANYFDERDREAVKRRAVQRLERLGFHVQLRSVAVPAV
jgi:hypothetical protein